MSIQNDKTNSNNTKRRKQIELKQNFFFKLKISVIKQRIGKVKTWKDNIYMDEILKNERNQIRIALAKAASLSFRNLHKK